MLAAIILITALVLFLVHSFYWRRRKLPPGPTPLPLVGNMIQIFTAADSVDKYLEWKKQYGPVYTVWLGPMPIVFVADYDIMQESFVKKGDAYSGRPTSYVVDTLRRGNKGIMLSNGNLWLEQRRFSLHVLRNFGVGRSIMEDNVLAETKDLVEGIKGKLKSSGEPTEIDVTPFLTVCTGSIINALLFGYRYENETLNEFERIKNLLDEVVCPENMFTGFIAGPIIIKLPIFRSMWERLSKTYEDLFAFLEKNLDEHRRTFDPNVEPTDFAYAYLNQIHQLKQQGKSVENYDASQFLTVALDLWSAGMETTLTTLRWGVLYMLHHPEVQEKIHQELDRVVGHDRDVIMADKPMLPYTVATINEIQRCGNILAINVPRTTTQDVVLAGYHLPEGTTIVPQVCCVHMDEAYFPSPKRFNPDRFLNPDGTLKKVDHLMPFSLGKRQCMGESLARMELFLVFTNMMQKFEVSVPVGKPKPTLKPIIGQTTSPTNYTCAISSRI